MKLALRSGLVLTLALISTARADLTATLKDPASDIKSAGPLAFAPEGVLFIGQFQSATESTRGRRPTQTPRTSPGLSGTHGFRQTTQSL